MYIHTLQIAEEYESPRKDFFLRLIKEVKKKKKFDDGLIEHLEKDYFEIGLLFGK